MARKPPKYRICMPGVPTFYRGTPEAIKGVAEAFMLQDRRDVSRPPSATVWERCDGGWRHIGSIVETDGLLQDLRGSDVVLAPRAGR